jgi:hypothetical protein
VNLSSEIDVAGLKTIHTQLWAEAVTAYKHPGPEPEPTAGPAAREAYECRWWLTAAEDALRVDVEAEFTPDSSFSDMIENFVKGKDSVRLDELRQSCGIEPADFFRHRKEFALVLKSLGFEKRNCLIENPLTGDRKQAKVWVRKHAAGGSVGAV